MPTSPKNISADPRPALCLCTYIILNRLSHFKYLVLMTHPCSENILIFFDPAAMLSGFAVVIDSNQKNFSAVPFENLRVIPTLDLSDRSFF